MLPFSHISKILETAFKSMAFIFSSLGPVTSMIMLPGEKPQQVKKFL